MSKMVVKFTVFLLGISILLLGYEVFQYQDSKVEDPSNQRAQTMDEKIHKIEEKIAEKEKEKHSLEEEKAFKIEVYKVWEKEVKHSN